MANNKLIDTMEIALLELAPNKDNIIFVSATEVYDKINTSANIVELSDEFDTQDVLDLIGNVRYVGIVNPSETKQFTVSNLMSILPNRNKTTVVVLKDSPISCEIIYPEPIVKYKYVYGNYEYSYGQGYSVSGWEIMNGQQGFGVKILDNTQTDYESPLTMIKGQPVTNMSFLFKNNQADTLNLINWDTSNVIDMHWMFYSSKATSINGLNNFNTSNVTHMNSMFHNCNATNLDLSNFDTSNVIDMEDMFHHCMATNLDVSGFNTTKVTNMGRMFYGSETTNLDLSCFDTSNVINMTGMFDYSQATSLDVSSFNTSKVINMSYMFANTKTYTLDLRHFNISNVKSMSCMFAGSNMDYLDLSGFSPSIQVYTGQIFYCSKIETLIVRFQRDMNDYRSSKDFSYGKITVLIT